MANASLRDVRVVAATTLVRLQQGGGSLTRLLPDAITQVADADRSLLQALCYGYARWSDQLDGLLAPLLKKPLKKKDQDVAVLMKLGLLQLQHMRIAEHAAVDTTVKAVVKLKKPWAKGLINGVLRNYQRQNDQLQAGLSEAASCSHPQWLFAQIKSDWPEHYLSIVKAANTQAPMTLRVNAAHGSAVEYQSRLSKQGMHATLHEFAPQALNLEHAVAVEDLPAFDAGAVSVQDAAAQLAAPLLASRSEGRLLDACAAPGGKTLHALELDHWKQIVALDKDAERLKRVRQNVDRLNPATKPKLIAADANDVTQWWDGELFDAILLDAPCSGTGVIRRHPDIKLLRRSSDIPVLVEQQAELLNKLWPLLKPGGYLLYATCSILKAENENQLTAFVTANYDAQHCEIDAAWGLKRRAGCQILTGQHKMDGFYYALLEKAS